MPSGASGEELMKIPHAGSDHVRSRQPPHALGVLGARGADAAVELWEVFPPQQNGEEHAGRILKFKSHLEAAAQVA